VPGCCAGSSNPRASGWGGGMCIRSCCRRAWRRCVRNPPPPGTIRPIRSIPICCAPYLLRQLAVTRANQVWALDPRYIPVARGFVYLTAIDVASRVELTHKVAMTMATCHAQEIIEQAFARYGAPEIVNTDQGSQFTAEEFTKAVLDLGCKLSMDERGAAHCGTMCSSGACGVARSTNTRISRPMTV
jgi:transposase InsO family protein